MSRVPSVLIPYPGLIIEKGVQDIAFYLRPETNGVVVESMILKEIHNSPEYNKHLRIIYLANIPGSFIVEQHIIEKRHNLKFAHAIQVKSLFTDTMKRTFEEYFHISFDDANILGSFESMEILRFTPEELFNLWVPQSNFIKIHEQSVKKYKDYYIVNYDIPYIMDKNTQNTDIFVMIMRSFLPYKEIHKMVYAIGDKLIENNIITKDKPISYVFHYSKSPFEQILDGIGYIYRNKTEHIDYSEISFFSYLLEMGCTAEEIIKAIKNPIMYFNTDNGIIEKNLVNYTYECSFEEAFKIYKARI